MDLPGPGLRVGVDDERLHLELALLGPQHRQRTVGATERHGRGARADVIQPLARRDVELGQPVGEGDEPMLLLRRRGHQGHGRRGHPRGQPRDTGHGATRHRARHVEREQGLGVRRLDRAERLVEGCVQRVDHRCNRAPGAVATDTLAALVGHERRQHLHGVNAGLDEPRLVLEPAHDLGGCGRHRRQQSDPGHGGQVTDQRGERHALEQCLPHGCMGQQLGRHALPG